MDRSRYLKSLFYLPSIFYSLRSAIELTCRILMPCLHRSLLRLLRHFLHRFHGSFCILRFRHFILCYPFPNIGVSIIQDFYLEEQSVQIFLLFQCSLALGTLSATLIRSKESSIIELRKGILYREVVRCRFKLSFCQ